MAAPVWLTHFSPCTCIASHFAPFAFGDLRFSPCALAPPHIFLPAPSAFEASHLCPYTLAPPYSLVPAHPPRLTLCSLHMCPALHFAPYTPFLPYIVFPTHLLPHISTPSYVLPDTLLLLYAFVAWHVSSCRHLSLWVHMRGIRIGWLTPKSNPNMSLCFPIHTLGWSHNTNFHGLNPHHMLIPNSRGAPRRHLVWLISVKKKNSQLIMGSAGKN